MYVYLFRKAPLSRSQKYWYCVLSLSRKRTSGKGWSVLSALVSAQMLLLVLSCSAPSTCSDVRHARHRYKSTCFTGTKVQILTQVVLLSLRGISRRQSPPICAASPTLMTVTMKLSWMCQREDGGESRPRGAHRRSFATTRWSLLRCVSPNARLFLEIQTMSCEIYLIYYYFGT